MSPDVPPIKSLAVAHCNQCGGTTKHDILADHSVTRYDACIKDEDGERPIDTGTTTNEILRCRGCEAVSFRRRDHSYETDLWEIVQYPPAVSRKRPDWVQHLPKDSRGLIDEVYRALAAGSRRLAMMGARALIDAVLQDKVGDEGGFRQRLLRLQTEGAIGAMQCQILTMALEAGHAATHRGHLPSVEDLNEVMDIVEHLLQATYVLPKSAERIAKRTPDRPSRRAAPSKVVSIHREKKS